MLSFEWISTDATASALNNNMHFKIENEIAIIFGFVIYVYLNFILLIYMAN